MEILLIGACSYLIGAVPMAIVVCRLAGLSSPLKAGSGNPGATNVARLHGKTAGAIVFILDVGKGALAVYLAALACPDATVTPHYLWATPVALILVNVGHAKSVFLAFAGGKCVASGLGALMAASLWLGATAASLWLIVFALWRISGLAGAGAFAGLIPVCIALYLTGPAARPDWAIPISHEMLWGIVALSTLVIVRHYPNYPVIVAEFKRRRNLRRQPDSSQDQP